MSNINEKQNIKQNGYRANDLVINRYRIVKRIAPGGMNSIVYLAEDTDAKEGEYFSNKNKYVAIKVITRNEQIDDDHWARFIDECVTSTRVSNKSNIISTYDVIKDDNNQTITIIMEYIDGISLRKYIEQQEGINIKEAVYLFALILKGIKELHGLRDKIIHRDLKPENILLTKDLSNLKIIDFGISSVIATTANDSSQSIKTNEKLLFGTYAYICPDFIEMWKEEDQVKKQRFITEQFDFFSLGVIFYEMLTGEKPFYSDNYEKPDVMKLPLQYDMVSMNDINSNIPSAIENIIFRCLASKPEDIKYRYTSVGQIMNDLEKYNKDPKISSIEPLLKPKNKRRLQLKDIFKIDAQKHKEKIYEKTWFYLVTASFAGVILTITLILGLLHELLTK